MQSYAEKNRRFITDLKDRVSSAYIQKIWKVPVSWQACGHYFVRAKSFEDAAKYIEKAKDIPLPADADFIDSTFEVDYEGKGIHNDEDGTVDPIDTTTIYTATSGL